MCKPFLVYIEVGFVVAVEEGVVGHNGKVCIFAQSGRATDVAHHGYLQLVGCKVHHLAVVYHHLGSA